MANSVLQVVLSILIITATGCVSDEVETGDVGKSQPLVIAPSWSIPDDRILGPYSAFPLVTNSAFTTVDEVSYPEDHLTTLISLGPDELRAYPNAFIAKYEIINNEFEDRSYAITHCPLTGSTICFDRKLNEKVMTFKASGYLFNNNLMPTDIESGTIWSQMLLRGVSGKYDLEVPKIFNIVETDWETVKTHFPKAKVYNETLENVQFESDVEAEPTNRDYYRYGIVSGVVKQKIHIFNYDLFEGEGLILKTTFLRGKKILIIGNKNLNFISSYIIDGTTQFSAGQPNTINFKDDNGNTYNAMGLVIAGPNKGHQLNSPKAYTAAWAAWQDFFDDFVFYE